MKAWKDDFHFQTGDFQVPAVNFLENKRSISFRHVSHLWLGWLTINVSQLAETASNGFLFGAYGRHLIITNSPHVL